MSSKVMKIGVMSRDAFRDRTIAIAKGDYVPKRDEPKVWFESLKSMAQVLNKGNQQLLKIIIEEKPQSLAELEAISGRKKSNLSRTLHTLQKYGVVEIKKVQQRSVPKVKATDFKAEFGLSYSAPVKSIPKKKQAVTA